MPHECLVLTDEHIPAGIEGWWAKLCLFRPDTFPVGARVLFFDLDTLITGSLDDIAGYDGDFAALSDIYHPEHIGSGLMAWEVGKMDHIWERWDGCGRPQFHPRGDQGWIEACVSGCDRLQDKYPGQIVSFKKDCIEGVPDDARVVAFHGLPRPHVIADLMAHWI